MVDLNLPVAVLLAVCEHVDDGVTNRARSDESVLVPSAREEAASPEEKPIDPARCAACKANEPARKVLTRSSFDDEVDVLGLHGKMHDSELPAVP